MFNKPEEILMAILAAIWMGANYYLAALATSAMPKYTFMITIAVVVWTCLTFWLWHKEVLFRVYPIMLGLLVGCWTFWLDWFTQGVNPAPWYATWWFKLILVALPIVGFYGKEWANRHKRQLKSVFR
ncbi:hypothetical protein QDY71_08845 [Kingella negevensis]|uniref:Uncharacterized protein n=1 Tax=Kingella negevensis TaxID=1522312 RepID=A0A238HGS3_9NEIS|nr:hypothetical protein [Kingella negevensis]MDK4697849.1 hypothetical protein [Kingella negevensis]MDK4708635.1 hypothetical protein [Kingella negevensis]MDK4710408.1 hypothetical protein [Kingella negevensis]SNB72648.1 Uncharacterised protein [Kingella negevensis]